MNSKDAGRRSQPRISYNEYFPPWQIVPSRSQRILKMKYDSLMEQRLIVATYVYFANQIHRIDVFVPTTTVVVSMIARTADLSLQIGDVRKAFIFQQWRDDGSCDILRGGTRIDAIIAIIISISAAKEDGSVDDGFLDIGLGWEGANA